MTVKLNCPQCGNANPEKIGLQTREYHTHRHYEGANKAWVTIIGHICLVCGFKWGV